ncbi:MAG: sugar phosphate isomerase/epimerase family protein [Acidimicrobiales bacterium]
MTWTLSGFADEISSDLAEQVRTLDAESIRYLELRSVWGTNVADLDDAQVRRIAAELSARGIGVSSIGSPIGKIPIDEPIEPELERLRRVCQIAEQLGTTTIRVFSFFMPKDQDPSDYRSQVLDRMRAMATIAEECGMVLAHENEKEIYGDIPERCVEILRHVDSSSLRSTFDAANFVQCGIRPYSEAYEPLRPYLRYVQIKDANKRDGEVVPAGKGDGQVRETLARLAGSGFDGFFSLEPHLGATGRFGGFSGPERFRSAVQALKTMLDELSIPWC